MKLAMKRLECVSRKILVMPWENHLFVCGYRPKASNLPLVCSVQFSL